jgi:hypothetical protein
MRTFVRENLGEGDNEPSVQLFCDNFVKIHGVEYTLHDLWRIPLAKRPDVDYPGSLSMGNQIEAAIAAGAHDLYKQLVPLIIDFSVLCWNANFPLESAVILGDDTLLSITLEYLTGFATCDKSSKAWEDLGAFNAVDIAIKRKSTGMANKLLEACRTPGIALANKIYEEWVRDSIDTRDDRLIELVLRTAKDRSVNIAILIAAIQQEKVEVVQYLLQYGDLGAKLNAGNLKTLPLNVAVRKQNVGVVEALLNGGADVNMIASRNSSRRDRAVAKYPIELAIGMPSPEVVSALIKHGATIPHVTDLPRSNRGVYEALRAGNGGRGSHV